MVLALRVCGGLEERRFCYDVADLFKQIRLGERIHVALAVLFYGEKAETL